MNRKTIPLLALVAVVVIGAAWYAALWQPAKASLATANTNMVSAQQQVASDQARLAQLTAAKAKVPAEEKVIKQLTVGLPNGPSLDQLLRTLTTAAGKAHVTVTNVGTPEPTGYGVGGSAAGALPSSPQAIQLSVTARGSEASLLSYVSALDSQPRIYVVQSFSLQPTLTGPQQTDFTVNAYYASPAVGDPLFPGKLAP